jgi:hypothetical protein
MNHEVETVQPRRVKAYTLTLARSYVSWDGPLSAEKTLPLWVQLRRLMAGT